MSSQKNIDLLIVDFLSSGGVITKCKPKLKPKFRKSKIKICSRQQIKEALGYTSNKF